METTVIIIIVAVILVAINLFLKKSPTTEPKSRTKVQYLYARKDRIMTDAESAFYKRLSAIASGRYVIFPQVHLSSLATNKTTGKYYKLGFQRINRRSVDYILADPLTLQAVYAVELDDSTHDTPKGRAVDALKNDILRQINLPLVRFRNVEQMTDEAIVQAFQNAH